MKSVCACVYSEKFSLYTQNEPAALISTRSEWKSTPVYEVDKAKVKSIFFYWIGADIVGIHTLIVAYIFFFWCKKGVKHSIGTL